MASIVTTRHTPEFPLPGEITSNESSFQLTTQLPRFDFHSQEGVALTADGIYTPDQVAQLLSCSRAHVYRLMSAGALRVIDISVPGSKSSKSRVRGRDLLAYLDSGNDSTAID